MNINSISPKVLSIKLSTLGYSKKSRQTCACSLSLYSSKGTLQLTRKPINTENNCTWSDPMKETQHCDREHQIEKDDMI